MKSRLEDTVALSIIDIANAYWNYHLAYENFKENEKLQARLEEREVITQKLISGGVRSKNDLLQVQVKVLENKQIVDECYSNFLNARLRLSQTIGIKAEALDFPMEEDSNCMSLNSENTTTEFNLSYADINEIINKRPDILALSKSVKAAEQKLKFAKINSRPDINLGFKIGNSGAKYNSNFEETIASPFENNRGIDWEGVISFSTQFMNNEKKGQKLQAQAAYESALITLNKKKNQLEQEISDSFAMLKKYEQSIKNAETIMQLKKNIYENEQKRYTSGVSTIENIINADSTFIEANQKYHKTYITYLMQILQVKYKTGNLIYLSDENEKIEQLFN